MATEQELDAFLRSVERRAFKRALYHVRDEDAALDIVQDSMLKLAVYYPDKPADEWSMLFQRILTNCVLDWFRRRKADAKVFAAAGDSAENPDSSDEWPVDQLWASGNHPEQDSAEDRHGRAQILQHIEAAVQSLPTRQREAFLLRYWEDLDVAETAAAMGCSEGSVKQHCSRAVATLARRLKDQGVEP